MIDTMPLVEALKRRDPQALSTLFEIYSHKIYRLAVSILHDEVQADSVVQDTFLALIEHIDHFEGRAHIGTWLYRVAYNECARRLRRVKPQVRMDDLQDGDLMPSVFVDWQTIPEDILTSSEARQEMDRAIASLPPALQAVFILRDVEELSTRETAEILGITESAVKVRLHRARLALREQLSAYFEEYTRT